MPVIGSRAAALRRDDFLVLDFEFVNLRLDAAAGRLVREDRASPAYIVVHFPAQHVAEEAFLQDEAGTLSPGPVPVRALLSGPSRLVFRLPSDADGIPYSLGSLLDWRRLEPALSPSALPPGATGGPTTAEPGDLDTAIELPAGLYLSPDSNSGWAHAVGPVTREGRTELWHTRLGVRRLDEAGELQLDESAWPYLRAIWSDPTGDPFRTSLSDTTRREIVRLSSDYTLRAIPPPYLRYYPYALAWWLRYMQSRGIPLAYTPSPVSARRFMLTSHGGWADLESAWEYPTILDPNDLALSGYPVLSLEQWRHSSTLGRDHYVRTVRKGFLCPTGHRASLVTVTERQFSPQYIGVEDTPQGRVGIFGATAYLRQHRYIVVQEPEKDYEALAPGYAHDGREMPLRRLRIETLETPKLDPMPGESSTDVNAPFWPSVGGQPFRFQLRGWDWQGQPIAFALPLQFVPIVAAVDAQAVVQAYNAESPSRREAEIHSQGVAFAPAGTGKPGSTTLTTARLTLEAQHVGADRSGRLPPVQPRFLPQIPAATVSIPAVERLLGRSQPVVIGPDPGFLEAGFEGGGIGEVFARLQSPLTLQFAAEKAGGVARPDMGVEGLSRQLGPVAKVGALKAGKFDTSAFAAARLLGGITLGDILQAVNLNPAELAAADLSPEELDARLDDPNSLVQAPVLTTRDVYPPGANPADSLAAPNAVETRLVWKPAIKDFSAGILTLLTKGLGFPHDAELVLRARTVAALDASASSFTVDGRLSRFALSFAGAMTLRFDSLSFHSEQGKKVDVSAEGVDLEFDGPLKFVNTLKSILPANGFSDPPSLAVTPQGVIAGYTLGVPSVGVGIFSIQNIALSAGLSLPFVDKPAGVRFGISERHHPFLVTVAIFGGGGFFALAANAKGIEQIEASIEFGGNVSLNLGIASGGVYVMAGIYFGMTGNDVKLSGFLRCGGFLEVLGIVSISIEFYMGLTYRSKGGGRGEVWGQASLTVCVKVAFFSKSVTLSVERKFGGAAGDPAFDELVEPGDWEEYCEAFAPE